MLSLFSSSQHLDWLELLAVSVMWLYFFKYFTLTNRTYILTFFVFVCQSLLDKIGRLFKVNADIEVVCVAGRYAVVDDACASIELSTGVDVHEGVSLCSVQDVGDAQALQAHHIRRHKSASRKENKHICNMKGTLQVVLNINVTAH